jgi:hypothetical protein
VGAADYYRAGHTMAILLDRHGADAFRRFDLLAPSAGEDNAFIEAFGEANDEFAEAAESAAHCEQSQWWAPLLECDGTPAVADAETGATTFSGNLGCGEADVQGPWAGRMWTARHFRLDAPTTTLSYDIDMPEDSTLEIVACNRGCPERLAYIGGIRDVGSFDDGIPALDPGDYFLRLSRPVTDDDGPFEIVIH